MFSKFRKTDEQRLTALEDKLASAREAAEAAKDALAEAALVAEETGNRQALERAERADSEATARVTQLQLASDALRKAIAAWQEQATAEARAERERATVASYEALRAIAGEAQKAIDGLGVAAERLQRAIESFAPFATAEDHSSLTDLRRGFPEAIKKRVRCVTGQPPLVDIETLLRYLPAKQKS